MNEYERKAGCRRCAPSILTTCGVLSFMMSFSEFSIAVFEYYLAREGSLIPAIFAGVFIFLSLIGLSYFIGLLKEKECLMLPLITVQIVVCAFLGLLVIVWWIGTLLAFFDLVYYKSPIGFLSTKEFYLVMGFFWFLVFLITCKISRLLYKGFQRIEKNSFYRRSFSGANGMARSLSRSTTCKPTEI